MTPPVTRLLVATGNAGKLAEFRELLAAVAGVELVGTDTIPGWSPPVEDGATFAENALLKARAGAAASGLTTLADDSGLCADALNGMPGIFSARWAGGHGDAVRNRRLLLDQLADVPDARRGAHFTCALAVCTPAGREHLTERSWPGRLARTERGAHGFGYDPVFVPDDGDGVSSAELDPAVKDRISHRGLAVADLLPALPALLGT